MIVACKQPPAPVIPIINEPREGSIIVVNEGNFGWSNADLTLYNPDDKSIYNGLFKNANGFKAGDVLQSLYSCNNHFYLILNNSGKIEVIDTQTFKSIASIAGLRSPRYMVKVSATKAYVSDLYDNQLAVIDLNTNQIVDHIECRGWTEELLIHQGMVYVTNEKTEYIYLINPSVNEVVDSIKVSLGSNSLQVDKNGYLWVACLGDSIKNVDGGIYQIDLSARKSIQEFHGAANKMHASDLRINTQGDTLYYIDQHVWQLPVLKPLPKLYFYKSGSNFYGLGVSPHTNKVYVTNVPNYTANGTVYGISRQGLSFADSFQAGLIPSGFHF
jgi:DNA-binding beta-propeller fold protein YncE